jgi:hypothetical protein
MLDERLKVWMVKDSAPALAASQADVAEFAILHGAGNLIVGDAEIRCRLIDRQQPASSGMPELFFIASVLRTR